MPTRRSAATVHSITVRDPLAIASAITTQPYPFALFSSGADRRSRWSFFGADPFEVFRGGDHAAAVACWRSLAARFREEEPAHGEAGGAPFAGGAVGYWAYDFGRRLERLPALARDDLGLPDFVLGFYDVVVAYEHETARAHVISSGLPREGGARRRRAAERLEAFTRTLEVAARASEPVASLQTRRAVPPLEVTSTFEPDAYRRAVQRVKDLIARGDIFQANLSQRWTARLPEAAPNGRAAVLFAAMTKHSSSPFGCWFGAEDHAIASASPERFLELRSGRVETRPIKGTRPRGANPIEDARLARELLASAKDRAENVMIVDVLRNDLSRVCRFGSVEAPVLCELETFAHVFHLTSTVTGRLSEGLDGFDLLAACFPGGSITGAPKIRAMEILEELEPVRRHVYTGSLGYLDWSGDADWNILIRTALVTPDAVHFAAGGGITAESDPDAELQETLHKAEDVRSAINEALGPLVLDSRRTVS